MSCFLLTKNILMGSFLHFFISFKILRKLLRIHLNQVTLGRVDGPGQPMSRLLARSLHSNQYTSMLSFHAICNRIQCIFTLQSIIISISIVLLIVIMILMQELIRIKYRLFAGQGEGKSFTDARQVREHFRDQEQKTFDMSAAKSGCMIFSYHDND